MSRIEGNTFIQPFAYAAMLHCRCDSDAPRHGSCGQCSRKRRRSKLFAHRRRQWPPEMAMKPPCRGKRSIIFSAEARRIFDHHPSPHTWIYCSIYSPRAFRHYFYAARGARHLPRPHGRRPLARSRLAPEASASRAYFSASPAYSGAVPSRRLIARR